jgi:hypothetical protein
LSRSLQPAQFDQALIFVTIYIAYQVFVTAVGDNLLDQFEVIRLCHNQGSAVATKACQVGVIAVQRLPAKASAQIFRDLLKRNITTLAKNNVLAVFLDERVFSKIVLVDRTRSRLMDGIAELTCPSAQGTFIRQGA